MRKPRAVEWARSWINKLDADLLRRAREERAILYFTHPNDVSIIFLRIGKDSRTMITDCCEYGVMLPMTHKDHIRNGLVEGLRQCDEKVDQAATIEDLIEYDPGYRYAIAQGLAFMEYV